MEDGIVIIRCTKVAGEHVFTPLNKPIPSQKFIVPKNASTPQFKITKITELPSYPSYPKNVTRVVPFYDYHLVQLFTYVPICERPKLALVCKKWKNALDLFWFQVKKLELIHWQYDEYPNCLTKYYTTSDGGYSFLKSLLRKCGRFLTTLDLTAYGNCNIVPVINYYCPNLETLRLRFTNMDKVLLANSFTRLSKLKSLTIIFQNIETFLVFPTVALINSLKNVANTLTDLNLMNWLDEIKVVPNFTNAINNVIRDLKALKRFECAGIGLSVDISNYLTANKILYSNHTVYLKKIPSLSNPFINITVLKMENCRITDDTLYTIANTFKHLKLLKMISYLVTDKGVVAISKMNNLQYLIFDGICDVTNITDSSVKLLKNLITLCLPTSNKVTDDSVLTVLENSPKMDALGVYGVNVTAEFVKKAEALSEKREKRLVLCVISTLDIQPYESPYFELRIVRKATKNNNST